MDDKGDHKLEAVLARAQAAVADLAKNFGESALGEVERCAALLKNAREDSADRPALILELYGIAHNLKGQGSSFGYPLVTRIGQSLCQLTRQERAFSDADMNVIQAHLDALRLILTKGIKGEGGEVGAKLAARLEQLAAQAKP